MKVAKLMQETFEAMAVGLQAKADFEASGRKLNEVMTAPAETVDKLREFAGKPLERKEVTPRLKKVDKK